MTTENDFMEIFISNLCFISLLTNMIFYWFILGFTVLKNYYFLFSKLNLVSLIALSSLLILRWYSSGHFPLSNLYESLIFLAWTIQLLFITLEKKTKNFIVGILLSPTILFIDTFANFALPNNMQTSSTLVPSLQSNWLIMHVTIMILSYGLLLVGCILSIFYLGMKLTTKKITLNLDPIFHTFDDLSYRTISIGFPLLTLGILSGAVWANETWGSYWNWDPKETWALITWFVFAIYLHTRLFRNWTGTKSASIATLGFGVIWVCYLGVNLLGKGLHSYGWFS
uniref:Cytochrome c biogenesis protein CcsA n=1 Tax=Marsupiomonas sp. NIES 1824 TaxID=1562198 RepID=A0A097KLU1_9CHLO|nr:heme attachment to plastid cytochrome c [Marsupiomonas sp. NIES 1824]